jgi:hypothetical protein
LFIIIDLLISLLINECEYECFLFFLTYNIHFSIFLNQLLYFTKFNKNMFIITRYFTNYIINKIYLWLLSDFHYDSFLLFLALKDDREIIFKING